MKNVLQQQQQFLANVVAQLDALSPLATLKRGLITILTRGQTILRSIKQVTAGDKINHKTYGRIYDLPV